MKQSKAIKAIFLTLAAVSMLWVSGCSKQNSQASDLDEVPSHSSIPEKDTTRTSEEDQPTENEEDPVQVQTLDFSRLNGVGNNLSNLSVGNHSFTSIGAFASDDTYLYFSGIYSATRGSQSGLWRIKLDGSECEQYIPDMGGRIGNFNLVDETLYYSQNALIYAADLGTKETRIIADSSGRNVEQLLVIGDRIYWTAEGGVVMTTLRDGSSRPYFCYRGSSNNAGGICELATDGEKLYLFVCEDHGAPCLDIYELGLDVSCEEAEESLTRRSFTATSDMGDVFLPVNGNFYAFGSNGFLVAKRYDETWKYEAMLYDDSDTNLRQGQMTVLGVFNEKKEDGSFYWREMGFPKFVLGNTLFAVYNSKYEEGVHDTVGAPHDVYMMRDMDVGEPNLVYTYSGNDFVAGGVCGDRLYLLEESGDTIKLTAIDQNGNIS